MLVEPMIRSRVGAFIAVLALVASPCPADEWIRYAADAGAFVLELPSSDLVEFPGGHFRTPDGFVPKDGVVCEWSGGRVSISWAGYSEKFLARYSAEDLLVSAARTISDQADRFPDTRTEQVMLDDHPGLELYALHQLGDQFVHTRLFLIDGRMYQVIVVGHPERTLEGDVQRIFKSVRTGGNAP